jgi:hypothetical protein
MIAVSMCNYIRSETMKVKYTSIIMVAMLFLTLGFAACNSKNTKPTDKQNGESISHEESTTILPFMNERQKQLRDLLNKGQIGYSKYKEMLDADNSVYEDLLISTDLSQYEVYTDAYNSDGSTALRELSEGAKRRELRDIIQIAISEDRAKWNPAISGNKYGTYITIIPRAENGEIKGVNRGMTIFVVALFDNSVRNAFECANFGKDSI